jgi:hypothetical protein
LPAQWIAEGALSGHSESHRARWYVMVLHTYLIACPVDRRRRTEQAQRIAQGALWYVMILRKYTHMIKDHHRNL